MALKLAPSVVSFLDPEWGVLLIWVLEGYLLDLDIYKHELGHLCLPLNLRAHFTAGLRFRDRWLKARAGAPLRLSMTEQRLLVEIFGYHKKM